MTSDFFDADRLRRSVEPGPSMVSGLDLKRLLDRLVETAFKVTDAGYAGLSVFDQERKEFQWFMTRGLSEAEQRTIGARPRGRGVLGLIVDERRPLRIANLRAHPSSFGFPAGHPPMTMFLGVPILIGGEGWGSVFVTDKRDGEFDEKDEEWILTVAAWAAIAVEHDRLLAAAGKREEALERAVRALAATQAIAVAVGVETDISRVLELVATRGLAMVEAGSVVILLRDGDDLVVAAGAGDSQPQIDVRIPVAKSTSGQVMLKQQPARISNVDRQLLISPRTLGVTEAQSALLVPLVYRGNALGVLAAFDRGRGTVGFTEDDEQVLVAFAASAATAVATAQTVQADRLRTSLDAAEAERKHWARELHDETLHSLARLKVLAAHGRRGTDLRQMSADLDQIVSGLQSEIEKVHAIISELRPAALDDFGLRAAIEILAQRHRVVYGIEVACELELPDAAVGDRRLTPELETTVYRLVQEALGNVAEHAGAGHVRIDAAATTGRLTLEIADDGSGFDVSLVDAGFGLTGMRERIALAGGTIEILSGRGGTTIRAALPAHFASLVVRDDPRGR